MSPLVWDLGRIAAFEDLWLAQRTGGMEQEETGVRPEWAAEAFSDLDADVRQNIERIRLSPFIKSKDSIRGFVYGGRRSS
jgi:hypothetical protein